MEQILQNIDLPVTKDDNHTRNNATLAEASNQRCRNNTLPESIHSGNARMRYISIKSLSIIE